MKCICKGGENPPYTLADFLKIYPQFETVLPEKIIQMYLDFAHHCIKYKRWRNGFQIGIGLFVAHFCTLYLQSFSDTTAQSVINAGQSKGLVVSKAVDGVSVSYDYATALQGLSEWGGWTMTSYGTQLVMLAKLYSKGMFIVP